MWDLAESDIFFKTEFNFFKRFHLKPTLITVVL